MKSPLLDLDRTVCQPFAFNLYEHPPTGPYTTNNQNKYDGQRGILEVNKLDTHLPSI